LVKFSPIFNALFKQRIWP